MRYTGRKTFKMTKNHQFTNFDFIFQKVSEKDGFSSIEMSYTGRKRYALDQKTPKFAVNPSLLLIRHDKSHEN